MLKAWGALNARKRRVAKISLCGLAACAGYAVYRIWKSKKYQQNRQIDDLPADDEKIQHVSKTINDIIFIDNLNVIRTETINFILCRQLYFVTINFIFAFVIDAGFNVWIRFKTKTNNMSWSSILKNVPYALFRALWDIPILSFAKLGEKYFFYIPNIWYYINPMWVWHKYFYTTYPKTVKYVVCDKMPQLLRDVLIFTLTPSGTFVSLCSYGAELLLGMKLKWKIFIDEHRVKRYKYFQRAMNRFEFSFCNIFNMNQQLIDTKYREERANIADDGDALAKLDESFYILSEFSSYWMFRRIACVNLWMHYLFTNPPN